MATYIPPGEEDETGSNLGKGFWKGYRNTSDDMALKKTVENLPKDATPRQVLDAITKTPTYNPETKQQLIKNYMGVAEYEAVKKKGEEERKIESAKLAIQENKESAAIFGKQAEAVYKGAEKTEKAAKEAKKTDTERESVKKIVKQLGLPEDQAKDLGQSLSLRAAEDLLKEKLKPAGEKKLTQAEKDRAKAKTADEKKEANRKEAAALYMVTNPDATLEQAQEATKDLSPASVRSIIQKPENVTDYQIAKNHAARFEKSVEHYQKKAQDAEVGIPNIEVAMINNEAYGNKEKYWDTLLDLIDSPFLNQFKSRTGQELEAITPQSVASIGAKMGGQLTNGRQKLISKKAVGIGRDKNANRLFLYLDYADRKLDILRNKFANEIIGENKYGLPPSDFQERLDQKMLPYQKMVGKDIDNLVKDKQATSPFSITSKEAKALQNLKPGNVLMISPDGVIGQVPKDFSDQAIGQGYSRFRND